MINLNELLKKYEREKFVVTKFLDIAESSELKRQKIKNVKFYFFGGFASSERVKAVIMNQQEEAPSNDEFDISLLKIIPLSFQREITHRHVLGTILSFGLKRELIGDIVINKTEILVFIDKSMEQYLLQNLTKINNVMVDVLISPLTDIKIEEKTEEKLINVNSLRLDALIAHALNISRTKSLEMIEKGLVLVNQIQTLSGKYQLKMNDLISIRHFGRVKLKEIVTTTKKNRLVVKIDIKH